MRSRPNRLTINHFRTSNSLIVGLPTSRCHTISHHRQFAVPSCEGHPKVSATVTKEATNKILVTTRGSLSINGIMQSQGKSAVSESEAGTEGSRRQPRRKLGTGQVTGAFTSLTRNPRQAKRTSVEFWHATFLNFVTIKDPHSSPAPLSHKRHVQPLYQLLSNSLCPTTMAAWRFSRISLYVLIVRRLSYSFKIPAHVSCLSGSSQSS